MYEALEHWNEYQKKKKTLKELDCEITEQIANTICAGVMADTAHLRLAGEKELEVLLKLVKHGAIIENVMGVIQTPSDLSENIAILKAAKRINAYRIGDLTIAFSNIVSHEAASCRALTRIGADIAIVSAVRKDTIRISSRSRKTIEKYKINLSEIFKEVGKIIQGTGGGHPRAGSANGADKKAKEKAETYILSQLESIIGEKAKPVE